MKIVLASIFGLVVATAVNLAILAIFVRVDPSIDLENQEELIEFMKGFNAIDHMIPLAAHIFGLLAGFMTARAICKTTLLPLLIVISVHMAGTVLNLMSIHHPIWFVIVDIIAPLLIFIPFIKLYKR